MLGDATAWSPPAVATVVVVPHPDDESLMFGGLIAHQRSRGVDVSIVSVTDGERSYPSLEPSSVAAIRRAEQVSALERLGAGACEMVRLHLPDGEVARDEDRLADRLTDLVAGHQLVVAPWRGDHHCDHEATGRAAATAAHRARIALAAGLFWTWHRVEPRMLDGVRLGALHLDAEEQRRRQDAVRAHVSQVGTTLHDPPLLSDADLEPVRWPAELYVL